MLQSAFSNPPFHYSMVWSIRNFSVNLATSEDFSCVSFVTSLAPISQKLEFGKIWDIIFNSFQHIAHLLCKDGHFWGWGGRLHTLLCDKASFNQFPRCSIHCIIHELKAPCRTLLTSLQMSVKEVGRICKEVAIVCGPQTNLTLRRYRNFHQPD